eukprot:CAMPEP_0181309148 /NCGR_PEP_ID=MMETSP1101-20121128/11859_1 /TAXON_ID=46948 /ORGANISM="Rhodomonas abbreviata, Strain Caron Lab Isolate" /LENGTH=841 /DNA_ID=CAMNT_0023415613 /DNA_START=316 /DNA_END=2841 /DNA_ORIENTATION=-
MADSDKNAFAHVSFKNFEDADAWLCDQTPVVFEHAVLKAKAAAEIRTVKHMMSTLSKIDRLSFAEAEVVAKPGASEQRFCWLALLRRVNVFHIDDNAKEIRWARSDCAAANSAKNETVLHQPPEEDKWKAWWRDVSFEEYMRTVGEVNAVWSSNRQDGIRLCSKLLANAVPQLPERKRATSNAYSLANLPGDLLARVFQPSMIHIGLGVSKWMRRELQAWTHEVVLQRVVGRWTPEQTFGCAGSDLTPLIDAFEQLPSLSVINTFGPRFVTSWSPRDPHVPVPGASVLLLRAISTHQYLTHLNLTGCKLGKEKTFQAIEGLGACVRLTDLLLSKNALGSNPENIVPFCKAIDGVAATLQRLDISNNDLSQDSITAMVPSLAMCKRLQHLDVSSNQVIDDHVKSLAPIIRKCHSLDLSNTKIGGEDLGAVLRNQPSLTDLQIGFCPLKTEGGMALAQRLLTCPSLRSLDISQNSFDDTNLRFWEARSDFDLGAVLTVLSRHASITTITAEGGLPWSMPFIAPPSLLTLRLGVSAQLPRSLRPPEEDTALPAMSIASVRCLDLSSHSLRTRDLESLKQSLVSADSLFELDISSCFPEEWEGKSELHLFLDSLSRCPSLRVLRAANNPFFVGTAIASHVPLLARLQILDLSRLCPPDVFAAEKKHQNEFAGAISATLPHALSLRELDLSQCQINTEGVNALIAAIKARSSKGGEAMKLSLRRNWLRVSDLEGLTALLPGKVSDGLLRCMELSSDVFVEASTKTAMRKAGWDRVYCDECYGGPPVKTSAADFNVGWVSDSAHCQSLRALGLNVYLENWDPGYGMGGPHGVGMWRDGVEAKRKRRN